ncbi:MAG: hypothetical protein Q8Q09_23770 [Deltaproteobacteria bacterium]|nr:hypothetical protein [Deltaproteobacteria bacterium]
MSKSLKDVLLTEEKRPGIIGECEVLIDEEVQSKTGLTGIAVKASFAVVKAVKPGIIRESVNALLDEFVEKMEPFYLAQQSGTQPIEAYFSQRAGEVADALLGVTDKRAERSTNSTIKKAYSSLRPKGKQHVEAAIPRLSRLVAKHAG